jgi:hypothetical protein
MYGQHNRPLIDTCRSLGSWKTFRRMFCSVDRRKQCKHLESPHIYYNIRRLEQPPFHWVDNGFQDIVFERILFHRLCNCRIDKVPYSRFDCSVSEETIRLINKLIIPRGWTNYLICYTTINAICLNFSWQYTVRTTFPRPCFLIITWTLEYWTCVSSTYWGFVITRARGATINPHLFGHGGGIVATIQNTSTWKCLGYNGNLSSYSL